MPFYGGCSVQVRIVEELSIEVEEVVQEIGCSPGHIYCEQNDRCLQESSECPAGYKSLTKCDDPGLNIGDYCESDGECKTN